MDALVMCGGCGTRLDADCEKPLFELAGRTMVDRVCDALEAAESVDDVYAAVSPETPETGAHLGTRADVAVVDTPGDGYVPDLDRALDVVGRPAVTVAADLPLLAPEHVEHAIAARAAHRGDAPDACAAGETDGVGGERETDGVGSAVDAGGSGDADGACASVAVCVPVAVKDQLGSSVDAAFDGLAPTGLNVVDDGGDVVHTTYDARLAVNVNRRSDARVARSLLEGAEGER